MDVLVVADYQVSQRLLLSSIARQDKGSPIIVRALSLYGIAPVNRKLYPDW